MAQVINRRFMAQTDEPFVVFMIGMRINRFLDFKRWVPTAWAMGPMLRELYGNPEKGFLGAETFLYWPGISLVQYWRSFEDLERFARDPEDPHFPAWRRFNRAVAKSGSVGIWHEMYTVEPGNTRSNRESSRRSTTTCRSSVWRKPPGPPPPAAAARPPAAGSAETADPPARPPKTRIERRSNARRISRGEYPETRTRARSMLLS